MARANKRLKKSQKNAEFNDKIVFRPEPSSESKDVVPKVDNFVDFEGYRFPKELNNPWSVSKVKYLTNLTYF